MKRPSLIALVALTIHAAAQSPTLTIPPAKDAKDDKPAVTQAEAQTAKSYDIGELQHIGSTLDGKLIKIKFSAREPQLTKQPDGSVKGQVSNTFAHRDRSFFTTSENRTWARESGFVEVVVPKDGVEWFTKVPSVSAGTAKTSVVYARVVAEPNSVTGAFHLDLLGREAVTDLHGVHFTW